MTETERLEKNQRIKETQKQTKFRRQNQVCKVYNVKIQYSHLNLQQKEQLKMLFVEAKWLYNDILNFSEDNDIKDYNTKVKNVDVMQHDGSFVNRNLNYLGSQMKQSLLSGIIGNIKGLAVLKKHKVQEPGKLKHKSDVNSINLKQYGTTYRIENEKYISIQGIKKHMRVYGLDKVVTLPGVEFANAKLLHKPDGYYIAVTTYIPKDIVPAVNFIGKEIGIDMGIKDSITLSNGEKFKSTIEETERLKRLQKQLFRRIKGSNNRRKTQSLIAKEYQHISNIKNDTANKLVHYILQYETIYMQDENISGWHKGLFGKQVQHSILGRVKSKLINHPRVEVLKSYRPTTQYCPICGNCTKHTLDKRVYHCDYCGYEDDRDIHAAKNMIRIVKLVQAGYDIKVNNQSVPVENSTLVPTDHREFKPLEIL